MTSLSPRLAAVVNALPPRPGLRVIEIGCGPGATAGAVAERVGPTCRVLAVDRSAEAVSLEPDEEPYDLTFAVRVGAFDGHHPDAGVLALERVADVLRPGGRFFVDGGDPLREVDISGMHSQPNG